MTVPGTSKLQQSTLPNDTGLVVDQTIVAFGKMPQVLFAHRFQPIHGLG